MNKNDERFQKWLAYHQAGIAVFVAVGTVFITLGISWSQFGLDPSTDTSHVDNSTARYIESFKHQIQDTGTKFTQFGTAILIGGPILFISLIWTEKSRPKIKKPAQVLFDEMYDGKDIELEKKGYVVFSVKKLRLNGEPLQYDYSILKFVEENKLILITEDSENYGGCIENNIPCIKLGQNPPIDEIIKELESLKIKQDSKR